MKTHICVSVLLVFVTFSYAEVPLREHPRPDFERPAWVNLNGPWQFEFDAKDVGERELWFRPGTRKLARQIVVPFPWESRSSGIQDTEYKGAAWYSREVTLPSGKPWAGRDAWLVIGACDWQAKVWVNGQLAGEHAGGYAPFEVNLSPFAKPGQTITITIRAVDTTSEQQPTGKQVGWYTRTSGIWQTVYLEPRDKSYIRAISGTPEISKGHMKYDVVIDRVQEVNSLEISSPAAEFKSVTVRLKVPSSTVPYMASAFVKVDRPQLWSPESPKLYPVRFTLRGKNGVLDEVDSYFGLREISVKPAPGRDYQYIHLNGKPVYLRGALHQSFHPDGIYQYPDDATVRGDYELCKRIGINFLRIHIKAPVPRELYWADRLGVLIMQDVPNYWVHSPQSQRAWQETMEAMIARDRNHPCTFAWCDFNETWGIGHGGYKSDRFEWVERMYRLTRQLDPTRLVEDNSPCGYDHLVTDINSWHFYINDYDMARRHIGEVVEKTHPGSKFNFTGGRTQGNQPLINSEYGGISAGNGDQDVSWCFKFLTNELRLHDKIGGYVYTELSDIEWEHNGFVNYDRTAKQFGYDFWFPGMTLADLNAADFVAIDAPPMIVLQPGEQRDVPIKLSHWSSRESKKLTLRHRTDWIDGFGRRTNGDWQSQPARWEPFKVVDQTAVVVKNDKTGPGILGALLVEVLDADMPVARNYTNLLVQRGQLPRSEVISETELALRVAPMDFAECTFERNPTTRQPFSTDKVAGEGAGRLEYHLRLPRKVSPERLKEVTLLAELASRAGNRKVDWPARANPADYPQTDVRTWPTDVAVYVNDRRVGTVLLPDDPADARGALSHANGYQGSYGTLVKLSVSGNVLDEVRTGLAGNPTLRLRLEVPADAAHVGGLSVYGRNAGCYPLDPTLVLKFDGPHGLPADHKSEESVATDVAMRVLMRTAESGGQDWRYTTDRPDKTWNSPEFNDSQWGTGKGGFGTRKTPNAIVTIRWNQPDIWLRTTSTIDDIARVTAAQWRIYHDDDITIHVNGKQVLELKGYQDRYVDVPLDAAALAAFKPGANTIAVHCRQTGGEQNVDVGLMAITPGRARTTRPER